MPHFTDQLNRTIELAHSPKRIISLVPSQTELLFDLGLQEEIVGITKFCIHPQELCKSKPKVGGTKNINIEKIAELNPDLIIANKEENQKEPIEALSKDYPVWISDVKNLEDALNMIKLLGVLLEKGEKAKEMIEKIQDAFIDKRSKPSKRVAYLIWQNPYMSIGKDTFIHDMLTHLGLVNVFGDKKRYPITSMEELKKLQPDCLWLSSEPFPFKQSHVDHIKRHFLATNVQLVDGEMFSWYGSRLLLAIKYFKTLDI